MRSSANESSIKQTKKTEILFSEPEQLKRKTRAGYGSRGTLIKLPTNKLCKPEICAAMAAKIPTNCVVIMVLGFLIPLIAGHGGGTESAGDVKPNLREKSLIVVKICCLIIVFTVTFAGGISPYFFRWNQMVISLGTRFAGGVFLGTALMHFLSDSVKTFEDLTEKEYPFSFMLCTAGYLLTMLGDLVVAWVNGKRTKRIEVIPVQDPAPLQTIDGQGESPAHDRDTTLDFQEARGKAPLDSSASLGDSLLLILALCFHSLFEGISIGVAETKAEAWKTLWTVSLHKIFAAIAMGVALLQLIPNRPFLSTAAYSFAFAISSPIGVAIGILIDATTDGRLADWVFAITMGFACGVFIYVAVNHLLSRNHHDSENHEIPSDKPFYNFLAVVLGSGLIAVVMIWD
ncbi:zinc transporter 11 [Cryptomeria japonica]|uniref:zinc transporter 11 n=1 Tax=Cryptomeria japonica TaxID=3369 RepID=UPI0025ACB257|nr:zinc transporter 11 [Cryptomeria japonica]